MVLRGLSGLEVSVQTFVFLACGWGFGLVASIEVSELFFRDKGKICSLVCGSAGALGRAWS